MPCLSHSTWFGWSLVQTPLTKKEAIQALNAVLGLNGIGMINVGEKFVKAVPVQGVNAEGAPFDSLTAEQLPDMGQYVTHIVQLQYAKPTEMVQVLQPFAKMANAILPIDSSQILVLRDFTENVKRMLEMIKKIDVAIPSEFTSEVIPIKYALASDIASALNSLSSGGGGASVGTGGAAGKTTTSTRSATGSGFNRTGTGTGGTGYPGMNPGSPFGAQGTTTPGAAPGAGSSFTDRLQNIIKRASVSGEIIVLGQTKIISDERTNSLLIYASKEDMKIIKDIINKLDVVLAQVLIEAVVISVSLNDSKSLGVSYGVDSLNENTPVSGETRSGDRQEVLSSLRFRVASWQSDLPWLLTIVVRRDNSSKLLMRKVSHPLPPRLEIFASLFLVRFEQSLDTETLPGHRNDPPHGKIVLCYSLIAEYVVIQRCSRRRQRGNLPPLPKVVYGAMQMVQRNGAELWGLPNTNSSNSLNCLGPAS